MLHPKCRNSLTIEQACRIYKLYLKKEAKNFHDSGAVLRDLEKHEKAYPGWHRSCVIDYVEKLGYQVV